MSNVTDSCQAFTTCGACIQAKCNWCDTGSCFNYTVRQCSETWFSDQCPARLESAYDIAVVAAILSIIFGLFCFVLFLIFFRRSLQSLKNIRKRPPGRLVDEPSEDPERDTQPKERKEFLQEKDKEIEKEKRTSKSEKGEASPLKPKHHRGKSESVKQEKDKDKVEKEKEKLAVEMAPITTEIGDDSSPRRVSFHYSPTNQQRTAEPTFT